MAGADCTRSTDPPQAGHFFRNGPVYFSILSVCLPHLRHLYSYNGTLGCLSASTQPKSLPRGRKTRRTVLPCACAGHFSSGPVSEKTTSQALGQTSHV